MRITIGELTSEILPYSNIMESGMIGCTPFLKAYLGNGTMTKAYMLAVQVAENQYSVCDTDDDVHGERYLVTGGKLRPFIKERDFIRRWQGKGKEEDHESILLNVDINSFREYFYDILVKYQIIKLTSKLFESPLRSLKSSNSRLFRRLETLCKIKGCEGSRVKDFVTMIKSSKDPISFGKYKENEIKEIYQQLKRNGILLSIHGNNIMDLQFEKK